jgi:hypothetical protein
MISEELIDPNDCTLEAARRRAATRIALMPRLWPSRLSVMPDGRLARLSVREDGTILATYADGTAATLNHQLKPALSIGRQTGSEDRVTLHPSFKRSVRPHAKSAGRSDRSEMPAVLA